MNILIIDDDYIKKEMLRFHLLNIYPDANIRWFNNYQDAIMFIDDNHDFIDYIVLDWCFPYNSSGRAKYGMGRQLLAYLRMQNYDNKVIICSSDLVSIDENEYSNVRGSIMYNNPDTLHNTILAAFGESKTQEDIKVKTLRPPVQENTGYKRRKSSTPWWMK